MQHTVGWNDPPKLSVNASFNSSACRKPRTRVYHSIDGRGGSTNASSCANQYGAYANPPLNSPVAQPSMAYYQVPQQATQPTYCAQGPFTGTCGYPPMQQTCAVQPGDFNCLHISLGHQIRKTFSDPSSKIPEKELILASLESLQVAMNCNQLSPGVTLLLNRFLTSLENHDYQNSVSTLNLLNTQYQSEILPWIYALHQLNMWSQSQNSHKS